MLRILAQVSMLILCIGNISAPASSADFTCAIPGDERHLRLDIPGEEHLCEVSVTPKNGQRKVLWYANSNTVFCSEKTTELVTKYQQQWGFQCSSWPVEDDFTLLDLAQRRRLDLSLRDRRSRSDNDLTGLRVIMGPAHLDGSALIAVQWLADDGRDDALNLFIDSGSRNDVANWETAASVQPLVSAIDTSGAIVRRALIDRIDASGAVVLSTVIESAEQPEDAPSCRGEQRFTINPDGTLNALTPHRYSCID